MATDAQQLHHGGVFPSPLREWYAFQRSMMIINCKTIIHNLTHRCRRVHDKVVCKKAKIVRRCHKRFHSGCLRVNQIATNRPIATAAFSASILCTAGDLASQLMLEDAGIVDWQRSVHRGIGSGLLYAGFYSNFYRWLGACEVYLPKVLQPFSLPIKVATDTMLMTPLAYLPFFYWWMGLHQGRSNAESWEMYKKHFVRDASASMFVYIPGQVLNFSVVPGVWRVPFVNMQDFMWAVGFAYLQSGDPVPKDEPSPQAESVVPAPAIADQSGSDSQ